MSTGTQRKDPGEMSNEELLEATAELDPEKFPIATHAKRALGQEDDSE